MNKLQTLGTSGMLKKSVFAMFLIAIGTTNTLASGLFSLENFIKTVKTGRAEFNQLVIVPAKNDQAPRIKKSSGTFEFFRPGRFKFVYKKPFEQHIVANGQTLWMYDVDLNQVSEHPQAQALGSTPAALIASASNLQALQADFVLVDMPPDKDGLKDGLEWVQATPKVKDNSLQHVRIGFKAGQLAALDILDSFGQISSMRFSALQANVPLAADSFNFKAPPGVDVIRQ
jgi:outer membrane lipoprotein carrier protein